MKKKLLWLSVLILWIIVLIALFAYGLYRFFSIDVILEYKIAFLSYCYVHFALFECIKDSLKFLFKEVIPSLKKSISGASAPENK